MPGESDIAEAIVQATIGNANDYNSNVTDALFAIAHQLGEIAAALQGPWPNALARALRDDGMEWNSNQ